MNVFIRSQLVTDLFLYHDCFQNEEFVKNLWGHRTITSESFLSKYSFDNYIIGTCTDYNKPIGFCIFRDYKYSEDFTNEYFFYGGILPIYFNTGIGVLMCTAMLIFFFDKYPKSTLYTRVFNINTRSLKMLIALGFAELSNRDGSTLLENDAKKFNSSYLVQRLKKRLIINIL